MKQYGEPQVPPRKASPGMPADPSPELVSIYDRVAAGIDWLIAHDPTGAFHLWFESGLTPLTPMPAQSAERREDWVAYHGARALFESLWRKMVALEKKEAKAA